MITLLAVVMMMRRPICGGSAVGFGGAPAGASASKCSESRAAAPSAPLLAEPRCHRGFSKEPPFYGFTVK